MYTVDAVGPDGLSTSKQVKQRPGKYASERAARKEHARIMENVNDMRGCVKSFPSSITFADVVGRWRTAVSPSHSPATTRSRESYLRTHIMPRFGKSELQEMGVPQFQQFATDLGKSVSAKTTVNVLGTMFAVLRYAELSGTKVPKVGFADLHVGSIRVPSQVPFFSRSQAVQIIAVAKEPFRTVFALAWFTGMRAGEILALTVDDLDFDRGEVRISKSADDSTCEIRKPKTRFSEANLPMPSELEAILRNYLQHWKPNEHRRLFANRSGSRPRSRENVVRCGLKPVLHSLGMSTRNVGLHAFRHGLATELADASVPLTVLQRQLRHADPRTTLKVYAHAIPESQRKAMECVGSRQSLPDSVTLPKRGAK